MAPKQPKGKAKNKAQAKAKAQAAPAQVVAPQAHGGVNADHYAALQDCMTRITQDPLFTGVVCQLPLDIGTDSAAAIQPFAQDQWLQVRAGAEATGLKKVAYTAGGNAFWVDPFMCLVPGIPINRSSISKLQQQVFASPQQAAENRRALHVGILDGEEVLDMRGKLRLISPDEEFFALIFELDKVIASDPGEAVLAQWLSLIRSWTFVFELLPSLDACYWRCINLREHVGTSFLHSAGV